MMTMGQLRAKQHRERRDLFLEAARRASHQAEAAAILDMTHQGFASSVRYYTGKTFNQIKGRKPYEGMKNREIFAARLEADA